jgi:hypothetical protein
VIRTPQGVTAEVVDPSHPAGGYPLDPRYDLRNHSPAGYEMGYSGSGPAQLALALLADALGDTDQAQEHYQKFKARVIAPIEGDAFEISQEEIKQIVHRLAQERQERAWAEAEVQRKQQRGGMEI